MSKLKLTKTVVKNLPLTDSGQRFYYDTDLKGFGIRVGRSKKTYFAEKRVNRRTCRTSIGEHGLMTCEQARKKAYTTLGRMADGENTNQAELGKQGQRVTLAQSLTEYLEHRDLQLSTQRHYRGAVYKALGDWANRPLVEITGELVVQRHKKLTQENGPYYANHAMRVLRATWNFAAETFDPDGETRLQRNPVQRLSRLKLWHKAKRRQTIIKPHQLPGWFASVNELASTRITENAETVRDYMVFLLFTGLRRNEAAHLKWEHVDFEGRSFVVPKTKNGKALELPLTTTTHALLTERRRMSLSEYVFPGSRGVSCINDPRKQVIKVREVTGIDFTLHDLRRTFITIADSIEISHYCLKRIVNHSESGDVTEGYIISGIERLREPMEIVDSKIF